MADNPMEGKTLGHLLHDVRMAAAHDWPEKGTRAAFEIERRFAALEAAKREAIVNQPPQPAPQMVGMAGGRSDYLADDTGNRRWMPVQADAPRAPHDTPERRMAYHRAVLAKIGREIGYKAAQQILGELAAADDVGDESHHSSLNGGDL